MLVIVPLMATPFQREANEMAPGTGGEWYPDNCLLGIYFVNAKPSISLLKDTLRLKIRTNEYWKAEQLRPAAVNLFYSFKNVRALASRQEHTWRFLPVAWVNSVM